MITLDTFWTGYKQLVLTQAMVSHLAIKDAELLALMSFVSGCQATLSIMAMDSTPKRLDLLQAEVQASKQKVAALLAEMEANAKQSDGQR